MSGSVNEIHQIGLIAGITQDERDGCGEDADAALLLGNAVVRVANLLLQIPGLFVSGLDQHIHEAGFAVVHIANNSDIADQKRIVHHSGEEFRRVLDEREIL